MVVYVNSIAGGRSVNHGSGHLINWHTGNGEATKVLLTELVADLIRDTVHLAVSTLEGRTLAFLAEEHGWLRRLVKVNLNAVERMLDDLNGHWCGLFGM